MSTARTTIPSNSRIAFRSILFALDSSPAAQIAFRFASEIARRYGARLLIAQIEPETNQQHVVNIENGEYISDTNGNIHQIQREIALGRNSIASITACIAQDKVDLVVLGTHGWTGLRKVSEGSKADAIAHCVHIPVLTIGPKVLPVPEFKRVLYLTDFSSTSAHAIPYAASLAEEYGASLDVLHINDPDAEETPREAADRMTRFVRDEITMRGFGNVFGRAELQFGQRTERIVEFTRDQKIDLIVIGQRHTTAFRARIAAHLPGGAAYDVIAHVHCAVLTVPDVAGVSLEIVTRNGKKRES